MEALAELGGGDLLLGGAGGGPHLGQDLAQQLPQLAQRPAQLPGVQHGLGCRTEEQKLVLLVAGAAEGIRGGAGDKKTGARLLRGGQRDKVRQRSARGQLGQQLPGHGVDVDRRTLADQNRSLRQGIQQRLY